MPNYLLKFGSYTFPATFHYSELSNGFASSVNKLPLMHGDSVVSRYKSGRKISVEGYILNNNIIGTTQDFQTAIDALRVALSAGPQNLQIDDARYLPDTLVLDSPESYDDNSALKYTHVRINFQSPYSYFFDVTEDSDLANAIGASPTTTVITVGGNVFALPKLLLTVGTTGVLSATVTNVTTGKAFSLNGSVVSGNIIEVDSLAGTVKIGSTDKISLFGGSFLEFPPGGNSLKVEYTSGTITNVDAYWRKRYQ